MMHEEYMHSLYNRLWQAAIIDVSETILIWGFIGGLVAAIASIKIVLFLRNRNFFKRRFWIWSVLVKRCYAILIPSLFFIIGFFGAAKYFADWEIHNLSDNFFQQRLPLALQQVKTFVIKKYSNQQEKISIDVVVQDILEQDRSLPDPGIRHPEGYLAGFMISRMHPWLLDELVQSLAQYSVIQSNVAIPNDDGYVYPNLVASMHLVDVSPTIVSLVKQHTQQKIKSLNSQLFGFMTLLIIAWVGFFVLESLAGYLSYRPHPA